MPPAATAAVTLDAQASTTEYAGTRGSSFASSQISRAYYVDVRQQRRRRHVEIPERMMHELKMPFALAGFQIDAHEALGKQVVAGPMAAVVIRCRRLDRQIDEAELFVHADLRPHAHVAVECPRIVLPGLVAVLAGIRNRVEAPQSVCRCARRTRARALWCCYASRPSRLRGTTTR